MSADKPLRRPHLYVAGGQLPIEDTQPYRGTDPAWAALRLDLAADELREQLRGAGVPAVPDDVDQVDVGDDQLVAEDWPTILAPATNRPAVPLRCAAPAKRSPAPAEHEHVAQLDGRCAICGKLLDLGELFEPADDEPAAVELEVSRTWLGQPNRTLDWASRHDDRSRDYAVRDKLKRSVPVQDKLWQAGPVLDQGAEGACVGFAGAGTTNALHLAGLVDLPGEWPLGDDDALALYERAQRLDDVPGEDYEGTSVLAGMLAGRDAGYWAGFLWAFGTKDVAQALMQVGPVVIGVPWYAGMYEAHGGLVTVSGERVGGHCLALVGIVRQYAGQLGPWFVWQNSWGSGYGDGGLGYVHHKTLAGLLRGIGEAAIPVPAL